MAQRLEQIAVEPVDHCDETLVRLRYGADPTGAHEEMSRCVAAMDPVHCRNVPRAIRKAAAAAAAKKAATDDVAMTAAEDGVVYLNHMAV